MNWTVIIVAGSATISAIATVSMAWVTYRTIVQARVHHKDEYRPILSLAPVGIADIVKLRGQILKIQSPQNSDPDRYYLLNGTLSNIGKGPALNVKLTLRFRDIEGHGASAEISPIGAGENHNFVDQPLHVTAKIQQGFSDTDFQLSINDPWKIILEYEDVFGQRFHTIHSKGFGQSWTTLGLGPAPQGGDPKDKLPIKRT